MKALKRSLKWTLLLKFTYHEAEEEADFCHINDSELSHRSQ